MVIGDVVFSTCAAVFDKSSLMIDDDVTVDDDVIMVDDDVTLPGFPKVDEPLDGAARDDALLLGTEVLLNEAELNVLSVLLVLSVVLDVLAVFVAVLSVEAVVFDETTAGTVLVLLLSTESLLVVGP